VAHHWLFLTLSITLEIGGFTLNFKSITVDITQLCYYSIQLKLSIQQILKKVMVSKCFILACGGIKNKERVCLASSPLRIFLLMKVEIITSILAAKGNSLEKLLQAQRFCQSINRECVSRVSASLIHSVQLNLFYI